MKNKSVLSITKVFKIVLEESSKDGSERRKPEKLRVDRGSAFYNKTFKSLLKEYATELYSTCSDLKAVSIERFNRTLLHIINKPMFINGDGNWVNIFNDAGISYNNNIHSTNKMAPIDASNFPDKVRYFISTKATPKGKPSYTQNKVVDYVRNADKRNIFTKGYTPNWNRELFKVNKVLKTQPSTYKMKNINGEIIEGKYYERTIKI